MIKIILSILLGVIIGIVFLVLFTLLFHIWIKDFKVCYSLSSLLVVFGLFILSRFV